MSTKEYLDMCPKIELSQTLLKWGKMMDLEAKSFKAIKIMDIIIIKMVIKVILRAIYKKIILMFLIMDKVIIILKN